MKRIIFIIATVVLTISMTSCGSAVNLKNSDTDVAGYTLKNKTELLEQKILNRKSKTVIAIP